MRSMPAAFRRAISEGRVDYTNTLEFTFADSTTLTLTNENIALGGAKMDDAVSDDGVFQVGAVIVNSATFTLVNIERDLDGYDFGGAQVVWYVGMDDLDDDTDATPGDGAVKMGTFYVDETEYDGHMITLRCLDNAGKLDIPFDWSTVIPTLGNGPTVLQIIQGACYQGGISWSVYSDPSAMYSYVVAPPDSLENTTCRQVMSWALQIAGLFGRCNADGQMVTGWYKSHVWTPTTSDLYGGYFDETTQSTYQSGDTADGGSFNPWDAGSGSYDGGNFSSYDDIDLIQSVFSQKLSLKDVEITGVKVSYKTGDGGASSSVNERSIGTAGYVISIDDNPLINTKLDAVLSRDTVGDILDYLGNVVLIGMRFRAGEIVHPSDPAIEAGDVGFYWDIHQNQHAILISSTEFSGGVTQRTVSSAASAEKNASTRYSNSTQNYSETMAAVARVVYPVGSIYMSVNGTNPGTLFGGAWEQLQNRFLLAAGSSYAAGSTGGEATHTLTTNEMPAHTHKSGNNAGHYAFGGGSTATGPASGSGYATSLSSIDSGSAGGGQAHNNMPPYLAVYMWKRTA